MTHLQHGVQFPFIGGCCSPVCSTGRNRLQPYASQAQLEAEAPALTIQPGDAAAAARGKQAVELLAARLTAEARATRAATLAPAEELAAELLRRGDLHNPFTHHTGPSLKTVMNQRAGPAQTKHEAHRLGGTQRHHPSRPGRMPRPGLPAAL